MQQFHVLQFYVLHFHASRLGPSFSLPAFSAPPPPHWTTSWPHYHQRTQGSSGRAAASQCVICGKTTARVAVTESGHHAAVGNYWFHSVDREDPTDVTYITRQSSVPLYKYNAAITERVYSSGVHWQRSLVLHCSGNVIVIMQFTRRPPSVFAFDGFGCCWWCWGSTMHIQGVSLKTNPFVFFYISKKMLKFAQKFY